LYTYFINARTEKKKASIYDDLFFSRRTQVITYVMYMEKRRIIASLISSADKRRVQ
jgi:hypothetical protein